jgi:hypothetical protein
MGICHDAPIYLEVLMAKIRTLSKFLSRVGVVTLMATGIGLQPASASTPVILPPNVNGTDNSGLMVYACPGHIDILAPFPTTTEVEPYSRYQSAQIGKFRWTLSQSGSDLTYEEENYADIGVRTITVEFGSDLAPGSSVTYTLTGSIPFEQPAGVTYTPESFNFTATVVDPAFASGTGTQWDPYIVSSQADLERMRCHSNKYFKLDRNISLVGNWLPIGTVGHEWEGTLDGGNYTISGLTVNQPTMDKVGLFGSVDFTAIRDLTLESPVVNGFSRVGGLIGDGRYGTSVTNVKVLNASLSGNRLLGLLFGDKDYGGTVSQVEVTGDIRAFTYAAPRVNGGNIQVFVRNPNRVGGVVGYEDGDGTNYIRVKSDVEIVSGPEFNHEAKRIASSLNLHSNESYQHTEEIGGFLGDNDEDSTYKFLDVKSKISIEAFGDIREVGGFAGFSESPVSHSKVETEIVVISLGEADGSREVRSVGGAMGKSDDQTFMFSKVDSSILIEAANGNNNSLNLTDLTQNLDVNRVGGMGGEWDDDTVDLYNRVATDIDIRNANVVQYVGGFVGMFDDNNSMGSLDNFVSGSIDITALTSVSSVGGFTNLTSDGLISGSRNIAAVTVNTTAPTVTDVNPFVGSVNNTAIQLPFQSYWDSTLNTAANANNYPVLGASTAQLQNQSFLAGIGFDFDNIWQISSGYPELRPGIYSWGCGCGSSQGSVGSGSASAAPSRPYEGPTILSVTRSALAGSEARVTGAKLNTIGQVLVNGQSTSFRLNSDGSLNFTVPNLAPGVYAVVFEIPIAQTNLTSSIEIAGSAAVETEKVLNAGSFNGYVAVYAKGYAGSELTWKIAGKWFKTKLTENYQVFQRPTIYINFPINVELYIDGKRLFQKNVLTR